MAGELYYRSNGENPSMETVAELLRKQADERVEQWRQASEAERGQALSELLEFADDILDSPDSAAHAAPRKSHPYMPSEFLERLERPPST